MHRQTESLSYKIYNYFYPSYYSVNDLLTETPGVKIVPVSQEESYGKLPGYDGGICAGLSTQHILMQLQSNDTVINPFDLTDTYSKSLEFQNRLPGVPDKFKYPTFLETQLPAGKEVINQPLGVDVLESFIKENINVSQNDKYSRGILFFTELRRNPYNGKKIEGTHALSMTIQSKDEKPVCTVCESNIFFASGMGKEGCEKISEKLTNTLKAYNPNRTQVSVVKCKKT